MIKIYNNVKACQFSVYFPVNNNAGKTEIENILRTFMIEDIIF